MTSAKLITIALLLATSFECDVELAAQFFESVQTMYWQTEKYDIRSHMSDITDCTFLGLYGIVHLKIGGRNFEIEKKGWPSDIRVEMVTDDETCQEFSLDWCFQLFWKFKSLIDIKDKKVTIDQDNWVIESNLATSGLKYEFGGCQGPMTIEGDSKTYMASINFGFFDNHVRAGLAYEHEEIRGNKEKVLAALIL